MILHIGLHKTGSSALQALLAQRVDLLAANGIAYPYPDPPAVVAIGGCSGNGLQILHAKGAFRSKSTAHADLDPRFAVFLREVVEAQREDTVVLSTEYFANLELGQLQSLKAELSGHRVKVICFVRDPFDFAFSAWRQHIKTGKCEVDFQTYLDIPSRRFSLREGFLKYAQVFAENLTVLRYERHVSRLGPAFFRALGLLDHVPEDALQVGRTHNPSVSPSEAFLVAEVCAAIAGRDVAAAASRVLLARRTRRQLPYYNRALHEKLNGMFADAVPVLNRFLPPEDHLTLGLRDEADTPAPVLDEDRAFLAPMLPKLRDGKPSPLRRTLTKLLHPGVPSKFDPQVYLALNPDVAQAGLDPRQHYRSVGKAENRPYRLF